jgi:hypothetical protein
MIEPTLHDIARGTTGCGDDDDIDTRTDQERAADEFYANEYDILVAAANNALAAYIDANGGSIGDEPFTIEQLNTPHVHADDCNGTLEHSEEILCGYPGSTGHIYCG